MEATSSTPGSPMDADSTFSSTTQETGSNPGSPMEACSPGSTVIKEQHYVAADSNSSSTTKTFVPCKVCGDKASGYHYGVTSCEGCKGFFRRSIQKQIEYRCLRDGKCLVIRLNRNRCQYCRFKKCLAVGMSRDSVRYGRVPKRSRERSAEDAPRVSTSDADRPAVEPKPAPTAYDVIVGVAQAHQANCGYLEELTRALARTAVPPPPASPAADAAVASSTAETGERERRWLWRHFAASVTPGVTRLVEFAKRVPGFAQLGQDDQLILIKAGFFEVWVGHAARTTSERETVFDDGTVISRQQLETMYDADFASSLVQFATSFNALCLNDAEVGLFSAMVLLTADRPGITDTKGIERHQEKLKEAMKLQLGRNHPNEPQIYATVIVKLKELRVLGVRHTVHLAWFRMNWRKLVLPPLFAEIFDIPKNEELKP